MVIENLKKRFYEVVKKHKLLEDDINIKMRLLKPHEAIGYPTRDDYPLLKGKEVMIEAAFRDAKGQAFTDEPSDFSGTIKDITNLKLNSNRSRAVFIASVNAVLRHLQIVKNTVHCKDKEPEECALEISKTLLEKYNVDLSIGLIGLQPAIAEELIKNFSSKNIRIADLDKNNIGKDFNGVVIEDGNKHQNDIISNSSLVLATGSTIVNNSIDDIIEVSYQNKKTLIFFGVTIAGPAELLGLNRLCFKSHEV